MNALTVPVTITPEAEARVDELGLRAELGQVLEHTQRVVPGLVRFHVVLTDPYDTAIEPGIGIEAHTTQGWAPGDETLWEWGRWKVSTFPPQVGQFFTCFS